MASKAVEINEISTNDSDRIVSKYGNVHVTKENVGRRKNRYFNDVFTSLVDAQWRWTLVVFASNFIVSWTIFACLWYSVALARGDISYYSEWLKAEDQAAYERAHPYTPCVRHLYTFLSAYLFSIETQVTIGYGFRHVTEECVGGPILITTQSLFGSLLHAFMVGVIIAKLARPKRRARQILFSKNAVIYHRDGVPCLVFRIGDTQKSFIIHSHVRARIVRKHITKEGELLDFYQQELPLTIDGCDDRIVLLWPTLVCHQINEKSPLYNMSANDFQREQFEILVMLEGGVESTGLQAQARSSYLPSEILWGHRFQSVVTQKEKNGDYEIDYKLFHDTYKVDTPTVSAKNFNDGNNNAGTTILNGRASTFI